MLRNYALVLFVYGAIIQSGGKIFASKAGFIFARAQLFCFDLYLVNKIRHDYRQSTYNLTMVALSNG